MTIPYYIHSSFSDLVPSDLVGGKASNLLWLKQAGASVPDFFILTTEAFLHFKKHKKLPDNTIVHLNLFLKNYSQHQFAVRSSVTGEDGAQHSFAGLFETFLNCETNDILLKIELAYDSIHSPRVLEYLKSKKIENNLAMALVIQVMSKSTKSGVVFTRSPIAPTSVMVIDAGLGLGEGVVSGHVDVETIQLTRLMEPIHRHGPKILTSDEIEEILKISLKLENAYQKPCDLEWSIDENKRLHILQIRPITQLFRPLKALADTNLSESYPGIVSPFTALFVRRSYENVFIESAVALGASKARLKELSGHYAQLIASVDNHLYYDLEHYYAILRALPGGDKNIENWHQMIGGKMQFLYIQVHGSKLKASETLTSVLHLLKFIIFHKYIFNKLIKSLETKKSHTENRITSFNESKKSLAYLSDLIETKFDFGLTIINDVLIMMGLGILKKRLPSISESSLMELLKTKEEVTSVKPLHAIEALSQELDDAILKRLQNDISTNWSAPYDHFFVSEEERGNGQAVNAIKKFLSNFGDRSFEELKLESFTFKQSPSLLAQTIMWMRKQNNQDVKINSQTATVLKLKFFDKKVLSFTQKSIEMRETTRMWRGKFYNLMREAMIKSAALLKAEDESWSNFELKDFFSITHDEWKLFSQDRIDKKHIQNLILKRESWKSDSKKSPEFLIWDLEESLPQTKAISMTDHHLKGVGVSMGKVQGKCLVIDKPEEAFQINNINNYILVTKNTDPAWVFIMSKSKGLISEKGSLLSHTAIIGRELNIPTIVGVTGVTTQLKTDDLIEMDPSTGLITKL